MNSTYRDPVNGEVQQTDKVRTPESIYYLSMNFAYPRAYLFCFCNVGNIFSSLFCYKKLMYRHWRLWSRPQKTYRPDITGPRMQRAAT